MTGQKLPVRVDKVTRTILASPRALFRSFLDAKIFADWRVPDGMSGEMLRFDPRVGGSYEMVLRYTGEESGKDGKSAPGEDHVLARFLEIQPDERIEEEVRFVSDDPAFAEPMYLVTMLIPVKGGTKVQIEARAVPDIIDAEDHRQGMEASLRKLALLTE